MTGTRRTHRGIATVIGVVACTSAQAEIINVPRDFPTIQEAIAAAADGDEIVVADGVYAGSGFRDVAYKGKAITIRSANGPGACKIECQGSAGNPHRAFLFVAGEGRASVLDGFAIVTGYAEDGGPFDDHGGAIFISGASPTIRNCVITNCTGSPGTAGGALYAEFGDPLIQDCEFACNAVEDGFGGAVAFFTSGAVLDRCTLRNNQVSPGLDFGGVGGAVWTLDSDLVFTDCVLRENVSGCEGGGGPGGAMWLTGTGGARLDHCELDENIGLGGGAIAVAASVPADFDLVVEDCEFRFNRAHCTLDKTHVGGAIRMNSGNLTALRCVFEGNEAGSGGAVYKDTTPSSFIDCVFRANEAVVFDGGAFQGQYAEFRDCLFDGNTAARHGGAMSNAYAIVASCDFVGNQAGESGGAAWLVAQAGFDMLVVNCRIAANQANTYGGGLFAYGPHRILNCTIVDNTAGALGGGVAATSSTAFTMDNEIVGTIVWNNAAPVGAAIALTNDAPKDPAAGTTEIRFCDVQGGQAAVFYDPKVFTLVWAEGNLDVDPMFVDPDGLDDDPETYDDNDYRLAPGSPCIDTADNAALPPGESVDLDGNPRVVNCVVDMGAYEFQDTITITGDVDCDGTVNVTDLLALFAAWGPCDSYRPEDINGDGTVDTIDLLALLGNWS